MGISGLLPVLKEIQVTGHISEFKGKRLAVDAYVWLHKGAFGCAEDLVKGKKTIKFVDYAMHRVRLLRYHGITPFVVFDGGPLPAKKGTEVSRAKSRAENLERARAMESQGRWREARDFYTRCLDITPEMAFQLIKALRAENVDYVVAPYEADAQLCFLEREGYVDGIITEDSDLLVFGCRQVIFKLDGNGQCVWIHRDKLASVREFPMHGWTDVQFRRMAMLSGCDYLDSIPGIGLKTAHRLLRRFNTVERSLQHVRLEGTLTIPPNYLTDFAQAELAFIHQRVYHPHQCKLIPLNDFPEGGLNDMDEKWIGLDVEEHIAKGMASGDIHPETRLPIVDEWPDFKPVARSKPLAESSKSNVPTGAGPMDAFITRMRKPKILARPVGKLTAGPSRLSDQLQERHSAPTILSRSSDETPTGPVKQSKFFSRPVKRKNTPERAVQLVWESSDGIEPEPEAESSLTTSRVQSRSPSIRSPSPAISSVRGEATSPARSVFSEGGHILTSPGTPRLSSPVCSSPAGIPFTTPKRKENQRIREDTPPSPTGATVAGSVLIAASSLVLEESVLTLPEAEYPMDTITPVRKEVKMSKLSTFVPRSTPSDTAVKKEQAQLSARDNKHLGQFSSVTSSDTIEDEEIVTPSLDQLRQKKRKRVKEEAKEEEVEEELTEEEIKRRRRADVVAQGWRAKYAFVGNSSSSPASASSSEIEVDVKPKIGVKRTKSEPTPRISLHSTNTSNRDQNQNQTPRPLIKAQEARRGTLPISMRGQASRVLMSKSTNIPSPSPRESAQSGRKLGLGLGLEAGTTRKLVEKENDCDELKGKKEKAATVSSPTSSLICDFSDDEPRCVTQKEFRSIEKKDNGKENRDVSEKEKDSGCNKVTPAPLRALGAEKTSSWSKLQKYKFTRK